MVYKFHVDSWIKTCTEPDKTQYIGHSTNIMNANDIAGMCEHQLHAAKFFKLNQICKECDLRIYYGSCSKHLVQCKVKWWYCNLLAQVYLNKPRQKTRKISLQPQKTHITTGRNMVHLVIRSIEKIRHTLFCIL